MAKAKLRFKRGQRVTLDAEALGTLEMRMEWRKYADQVAMITQTANFGDGRYCIVYADGTSGWFDTDMLTSVADG